MGNASIDSNSNPTITARLNTDGLTVIPIKIDPTTHGLEINDDVTGSDNGGNFAATDSNSRPTMFVVSSSDGASLIGLYADSSGNLLVKSS